MLTRCWLPPESVPTWSSRRSTSAGLVEHPRDRGVDVLDPLEPGEQAQVLGHGQAPVERRGLRHPADLARARDTAPASGSRIPARIESSVVLPAPLGPITASSSPARAVNETPRRAARSPKRLLRSRTSMHRSARLQPARSPAAGYGTASSVGPGMKVLFVGDVVGKPGRAGLARAMPGLRERHAPDLVIVNGENSAGGLGITEKTGERPVLDGRRRDHARQPRLPPPRRLRLPRPDRARRPAGELHGLEPRPRARGRRGRGHAGRA